jgi:cation diffusion facilitator family transporter
MDECCHGKGEELAKLKDRHGSLLKIVLVINLVMFLVEVVAGWLTRSSSLYADSLDMLGDAFVYAISLYVIGRGPVWSARVSLIKGMMMLLLGSLVLFQITSRFLAPVVPDAKPMGAIAVLALLANTTCAILLLRHRNDDLNMRSTWLCSRNDVLANLGVILAAGIVAATGSHLPDLVIGLLISGVVLHSGYSVVRDSLAS